VTAARRVRRAAFVGVIVLLAVTTSAHAQSAADAAFKRGRELLKAGKHADACVEFEHSQKLDPAHGTAFNIAQCSEKIGKLARALELYRELAASDANAQRKQVAADAIPGLEQRVPKLHVRIAQVPTGLVLTIRDADGMQPPRSLAANQPVEIDFGVYTVLAKAPGISDWTQTVRIDQEGKTTALDPPFGKPPARPDPGPDRQAPDGMPSEPDDPDMAAAPSRRSSRKLAGTIAIAAGGAALIGGSVFGLLARSSWQEAKAVCGGTVCATSAERDRANEIAEDARGRATLSTALFVGGALAAGLGVVLVMTAPSTEREARVSGYVTPDGGGVTLIGRF
jgi:hypothetical protein